MLQPAPLSGIVPRRRLGGRAVGAADDEHTRLGARRVGNQERREDVVRALDLLGFSTSLF